MKLIILRFAFTAPKICDARPPPESEKRTRFFSQPQKAIISAIIKYNLSPRKSTLIVVYGRHSLRPTTVRPETRAHEGESLFRRRNRETYSGGPVSFKDKKVSASLLQRPFFALAYCQLLISLNLNFQNFSVTDYCRNLFAFFYPAAERLGYNGPGFTSQQHCF